MIQKSLIEQLEILLNVFKSNKYFLIISIISIVLLIILVIFNHLNNKRIPRIITIITYLGIISTLLILYYNEIFMFIDYLINNIFILLFFPNVAVYTLVIIIINILMIKSILNKTREKVIKIINIVFFVIFNIIFYLIIDNVISNNVDIYNGLNVYTNSNLMVLIQISMYLFIIWLIILLINNLSKKLLVPRVREKVITERNQTPIEEINTQYQIPFNPFPKILEPKKFIPEIPDNYIVVSSEEKNKLTENNKIKTDKFITDTTNLYNNYIDIVPVKKKKIIEHQDVQYTEINNQTLLSNMDIIFGRENTLSNIMKDVTKLKEDKNNLSQIRKIYQEISLNSKELTLSDYNYLIKTLKEIKNNN